MKRALLEVEQRLTRVKGCASFFEGFDVRNPTTSAEMQKLQAHCMKSHADWAKEHIEPYAHHDFFQARHAAAHTLRKWSHLVYLYEEHVEAAERQHARYRSLLADIPYGFVLIRCD